MTDITLVRYPIKRGQKQVWLDWCEELKRREDEAVKTLEDEEIYTEACFIDPEEEYVYLFIKAKNFKKAQEKGQKSTQRIDIEYRKNRLAALLPPVELKQLFHFEFNF